MNAELKDVKKVIPITPVQADSDVQLVAVGGVGPTSSGSV